MSDKQYEGLLLQLRRIAHAVEVVAQAHRPDFQTFEEIAVFERIERVLDVALRGAGWPKITGTESQRSVPV